MEVKEPSALYLPNAQRETEVGPIPVDWEIARLDEITDRERPISYGIVQTGPRVQNGIPCLRVVDIQDGKIRAADLITTTDEISNAYRRTKLRKDDLVVPLRGKVGECAQVTGSLAGANLTRGVALVAVLPKYSASYCRQFFSSSRSRARLNGAMNGSALQEVPIATLRSFKIALPPTFGEQNAIAKALADADALIDSLEQLLTKKRQIKQGAMQELLTGKRRLPGFSGEWASAELRLLGHCIRGVSYNPATDLSEGDNEQTVRLLRSNNVQSNEIVRSGLQYVNHRRVRAEQYLQTGDLLLCMANGSRDLVGKAGRFVGVDEHRYTFGAFMGCFRPDKSAVDPDLVSFHLQTHAFRQHIDLLLAGSSINNLRPEGVLSFSIRVPLDEVEQRAISEVLNDCNEEISHLESRLTKARALKQAMAQALLTGRIRLVSAAAASASAPPN